MSLLNLGDEMRGRTLDIYFSASHWLVGVGWERHPSETQVSVHVGPLIARVWWARWWREVIGIRRCRICGCTEDHACPGGCWWIDDPDGGDLCSTCFVAPTVVPRTVP